MQNLNKRSMGYIAHYINERNAKTLTVLNLVCLHNSAGVKLIRDKLSKFWDMASLIVLKYFSIFL